MLGSAFDGERAAAALLISRMVNERGVAWEQLLAPAGAPFDPFPDDWREAAQRAAQFPDLITAWEIEFLEKLGAFPRISIKQRRILNGIIEKINARSPSRWAA
jgi:hypothetical protein